jgi:hypothetical protein
MRPVIKADSELRLMYGRKRDSVIALFARKECGSNSSRPTKGREPLIGTGDEEWRRQCAMTTHGSLRSGLTHNLMCVNGDSRSAIKHQLPFGDWAAVRSLSFQLPYVCACPSPARRFVRELSAGCNAARN